MNAEELASQANPCENTNEIDGVHMEEECERFELPGAEETTEEINREEIKTRSGRLRRIIIDSGSEDESKLESETTAALIDSNPEPDGEEASPKTARRPKRLAIFDSDSEAEPEPGKHEDAVNNHKTASKTDVYNVVSENSSDHDHHSRVSALCDPETSGDEDEGGANELETTEVTKKNERSKSSRSKEAPKKMTGREALGQKQEIRSASCRRARERRVSLPYHKPKDRTLEEFLRVRPRFADALRKRTALTSPCLAIKMSGEELESISKNMEERERKVEEFFKSESESEEETEGGADAINTEANNESQNVPVETVNSEVTCDLNSEENATASNNENCSEAEQKKLEQLIAKHSGPDKCVSADENKLEVTLKNNLAAPKLSGGPNEVIDLDEGVAARRDEVVQLMERFVQHAAKKNHTKTKVHVDVISMVDGEMRKEILSVPVDPDETESAAIIEKPGARLRKLRDELQVQMALRRSELWRQRSRQNEEKPKDEEEMEECDAMLDDEDEGEFTEVETESSEEEEELEEEKPREKCAFADEEAEESDGQETDDEVEVDADGDDESEDVRDEVKKKRKLKRIARAFADDSDEENQPPAAAVIKKPERKDRTDDSTDTWDDNGPPPNQIGGARTPSQAKSQLDFLTPVVHLTGLQSFNSGSKFLRESPVTPFDFAPTQVLQKKLFGEIQDEEVIAPSTQDLLDICSGSFSPAKETPVPPKTPVAQIALVSEELNPPELNAENVCELNPPGETQRAEVDENDDRIISQLLDEEELEKFKKRFESPLVRTTEAPTVVPPTKIGRYVFDSSDDDAEMAPPKPNKKRLFFVDEEEEDEEAGLADRAKIVEYDSEENEIDAQREENAMRTLKASDFVEAEAELSESDWGSADEDENDLDELEVELGDGETFDENKMRRDLERIHMRRILDDDSRKVKILQELLLEDGELHGTGRQRQFKWKNIDSASGDFGGAKEDESGIHLEENGDGENEEQWRKLRYQRELFLKKVRNNSEDNDEGIPSDNQSQVFKLGQAALMRSVSQNSETQRLLPSKRGSFLSRSDEVLTRLAEFSKVTVDATGAAVKNSRKFVFRSVTSTEVTTGGTKRRRDDGTPNAIKKLRLSDLSPAVEKSDRAKKLFGNW